MPMRCGDCRTAVDEEAQTCPSCGAPRTKFRDADLGSRAEGARSEIAPPPSQAGGHGRRPFGLYTRAAVGVAVVAVLFTVLASYSKQSHLEKVRQKCISTFDLTRRCDCLVDEIRKNTSAISFVPMLRILSGLSSQKLADVIREAAMTCAEPR